MSRERVAIIGFTSHRAQAAFEDPNVELWGLNDLYIDLPVQVNDRWRWFQLHHWESGRPVESVVDLTGGPVHPRDPNHVAWLEKAAQQIPVYLLEARAECPSAKVFPYEECYRYFAKPFKRWEQCIYFTNSISFMIGLAIMEGFKEIGIYGVDMMVGGNSPGSEYGWQRPSCEWLIGWAGAAGITIDIPDESDLMKTAFPYGDPKGAQFRRKLYQHDQELAQRQANLNNQAQGLHNARMEIQGARNVLQWVLNAWMPGDSDWPTRGIAPTPDAHKVHQAVTERIRQMEAAAQAVELQPAIFAPAAPMPGRSDEDGGSE